MQPIKLKPAFKDYIWGGTRLRDDYKMESDKNPLAEAWVLSCHKDGQSIGTEGEYDGKTLSEIIDILGEECLGNNAQRFQFFPILIKLIDAKQSLSVQVHPTDEYALKNENQFGKTEMWYVVDCDEGACLYYGFKEEISREEFKKRIDDNTLTDVLNKVPVKKGDCFFITAGTIHAIGEGILIAEIQQNSNCTYRVYDFGRLGADGKPRELHIDKALDVTERTAPKIPFGKPQNDVLASCEYFTAIRHEIKGEKTVSVGEDSFSSILCVDGELTVDGVELKAGECVFIPAYYGNVELVGNAQVIESRV